MRKIYMARKVSLIVIWPSFKNKMAVISHVKLDYPIKKALYPLSLLLRVPNVKMTYTKSRPETIFQLLTLPFDPFFNVKWGYLTTKVTGCLMSRKTFIIFQCIRI